MSSSCPATLEIPLMQGRMFSDAEDWPDSPRAVDLEETPASMLFGSPNAAGERV